MNNKIEIRGSEETLRGCAAVLGRVSLLLFGVTVLLVLSAVGLYYFEQQDENDRTECLEHGGHIEVIHNAQPVAGGSWVCVGATW